MGPKVQPALKFWGFFSCYVAKELAAGFFLCRRLGFESAIFLPKLCMLWINSAVYIGCLLKAFLGIPKAKTVLHN